MIRARLRRLVRQVLPWRVRDWIRTRRLLRQVRSNVDVVVSGRFSIWRWLATTPASYRAGRRRDEPPQEGVVTIPEGDPHRLAHLVGASSPVVVAAHAAPPPWWEKGTAAPMEPLALATTDSALADIYGDDDDPVPVLVDRFVQAGHRLTLLPEGRRPEISVRLDPIHEPVAVLLAAVPLHDVGGGSRGAQLAVELLRRGFHVTYVTRFASSESDDSGLRHIHPRLEQVPYPAFDAAAHAARAHSDVRIAICEIPDPGYLTAVGDLVGFEVVYDLVDDWSDPALGLDWYRRTAEGGLVELADAVTASAQPLVERLARFGAQATLVPNGVNEALFSGELGERPSDLPQGSPVLGYHGSLYGNWFDWEALAAVAEAWSDGAVVLIGDHDAAPALPPNVHFLGPRPQFQLPPYVGRFDVGLVPFTVTKTTHAVSPLKVFEYLAMGVPVAAPPLRSLHGLDGVHTSGVLVEATAAALEASPPDAAAARHSHGWGPRLEGLLGALGHPLPPVVGPDTRFELRRTVRYPSGERRLR